MKHEQLKLETITLEQCIICSKATTGFIGGNDLNSIVGSKPICPECHSKMSLEMIPVIWELKGYTYWKSKGIDVPAFPDGWFD